MVFFAIAYVMDWSGQSVINGVVTLHRSECIQHERGDRAHACPLLRCGIPTVQPDAGPLRGLRLRERISSNVMFYGILKKSTDVLNLNFMQVYAAHAVPGGIASGVAVAKIINAAAVVNKLGIEGEVVRKVAPVAIVLTLLTGVMLVVMLIF